LLDLSHGMMMNYLW